MAQKQAVKPAVTGPSNLHAPPDPRTRTKSNEEVIREELRTIADSYIKIWQSGMTLLPALMVAMFYFRRQMIENFILIGRMKPGELLPFDIYLIGTLFVAVVCIAFCLILRLIGNRYRYYAELMTSECTNHLSVPPPSKWGFGRGLFYFTLLAFPAVDILLYQIYKWRLLIDFAIVAR